MSAQTHGDRSAAHVRGYLVVFGSLLLLTLVTVAASYLNLATGPTVALGLTIATVKAALVAAFFMHLLHERTLIYAALGLTAAVALSLFGLTLWTEAAHAPGTQFAAPFTTIAPEAPSEGVH
jgi:cytochrome c oxidase subunit 4